MKQLNQFQPLSRRHIWKVSGRVIGIFPHCTIEIALLMEEAGEEVSRQGPGEEEAWNLSLSDSIQLQEEISYKCNDLIREIVLNRK